MNSMDRRNYRGKHILTSDYACETDTWVSGVNNNVLVFGPSGAGKTRSYVKPNLLISHESMVIVDTKGSLVGELAPVLQARGYEVQNIDFTDLKKGTGYNPMDYIGYEPETDRYNEQNVISLANCLIDEHYGSSDPFWNMAARQYVTCLISYVLEALPKEQHTLDQVIRLLQCLGGQEIQALMDELNLLKPWNMSCRRFDAFKKSTSADKMFASICGIVSANLYTLVFDDAIALYHKPGRIDFAKLGRQKTALFLTISDTDRSLDKLANAFVTQAIQTLCSSADHDYPDHRLPVPVRFYLDDFATNLSIPAFDKIISVIRSREISVSVILQSLTQLYSLYCENAGKTILNNCDRQLYLGGQDPDTAEYIAVRANKPVANILSMPVDQVYLLVRGEKPRVGRRFQPERQEESDYENL